MFKIAFTALSVLLSAISTFAAEVVFHGSIAILSTTGCPGGWNPVGDVKSATYWLPIAGSTNGNKSVITMREGDNAGGFAFFNGRFSSAFQSVEATHIGTLTGNHTASLKVSSQSPQFPTSTTRYTRVIGAIKGFDARPACTLNFYMSVYR